MSSTSERSSEKTFLCSICLEVFSEPVSTPCGHNFCKRCICEAWDTDGACTCPLCNRRYHTRPELSVNTLLRDVMSESRLDQNNKKIWVYTLCFLIIIILLICQVIFRTPRPLSKEACERRRSSLLHSQAHRQNLVEQRRLRLQEIQRCLELSDTEVHRERAEGLRVFSALMQSVQRRLDGFLEELQEKQRRSHRRAQELEQQLEQVCELEKSSAEAERLWRPQDPLRLLQSCPAPPAGLKECSSVSFEPETCEGSAARALEQLHKTLSQEFHKHSSRLELKRVQKFAVDVTLDPDSAHPALHLSEDLKHVHHTGVRKKLPDSPLRFDTCVDVLGKQSFSSGRFYFEVQVKGKTKWSLGLARRSISRKGLITLSPKNGFWCMWLRNKDEYKALADPDVLLSPAGAPQKVGVFVDYAEGLLSFYDADSADLLFSFTGCSFREKLVPFFSPGLDAGGSNSAPLVLTAVERVRGHRSTSGTFTEF